MYPSNRPPQSPVGEAIRSMIVGAVMCVALLYLINPTLGVFELLPDNLPLIGNLDDGAATALILGGLRYFGIDLLGLFKQTPTRTVVRRRRVRPRAAGQRQDQG